MRLETRVLSTFLNAVAEGREDDFAAAAPPLIRPDAATIHRLTATPPKKLARAWQRLFGSAGPGNPVYRWVLSPHVTALAVAACNFVSLCRQPENSTSLNDYLDHLLEAIAPATDQENWLTYDLIIEPCARMQRRHPGDNETTGRLLTSLFELSPLSELKNLDLHLPPPLQSLVSEYLVMPPGRFGSRESDRHDDRGQWWVRSEKIFGDPELGRVLRQGWLQLPEQSNAAVGIGIFLEEMRLRGEREFRRPILEYYEACDYLARKQQETDGQDPYPEITIIRQLLSSRNRTLNHKGNARFLRYRALLEIIASEQGIPGDFRHLSREFCLGLLPLARLATIIGGRRQGLMTTEDEIEFSDHPN